VTSIRVPHKEEVRTVARGHDVLWPCPMRRREGGALTSQGTAGRARIGDPNTLIVDVGRV
jgi:hypothetical protein